MPRVHCGLQASSHLFHHVIPSPNWLD
uniref:Uncharacterized protein n=1 Tax=Arundo donax TaxID=35708 RepID=A0A0A8Y6I5_ARUDO